MEHDYVPHLRRSLIFGLGNSLPLIFCIHVRLGPIYWGVIYLAKKILRWWYFTCKKPENIICDGIFTKFIYNEYIGPYFLSNFVLNFLPVNSPRDVVGSAHCIRSRKGGVAPVHVQYHENLVALREVLWGSRCICGQLREWLLQGSCSEMGDLGIGALT